MIRPPRAALLVCCASVSLPAAASGQERSAAAWRELAAADVEAATALIADNHPAAARATGDTGFRLTLEQAARAARERAARVMSYEGWLATLRAFAAAFADPHIMLSTRLSPGSVRWPGFVLGRREGATVVMSRDSAWTGLPAVGARLVSCDGVAAERLARERLGTYRGTWDVVSQQVRYAPLLLVDDGNPFLPLIRTCVFREGENGAERKVSLEWRPIQTAALLERTRAAAPVGRAGFGVRRVGAGWWIALQALDDRAKGVLDSVAANIQALWTAPWVVVDVRGNSGGNSLWGQRLADLLVGEPRVRAALRRAEREVRGPLCGTSWRASALVEETLDGALRRAGAGGYAESLRRDLDSVRAARAAGRELAPMPRPCPPPASDAGAPGEPPQSRMQGRLLLLTDHACFSSCLLLTPLFRLVGATHLGEATDFSTRYMEVRGVPLPSGLGSFSTLMKVSFGAPKLLGPFEPEVTFPGRIDDTAELERWVTATVAAR